MIHIVHNEADIDVLKQAQQLDESLAGEVWQVKDDFGVGPLQDLFTEKGRSNRLNWWRQVLSGGDLDGKTETGEVDDNKLMMQIKETLDTDPEQTVWIWVAPNTHDICSYYWMVAQLADYVDRVFVLHLNNLPFLNEKGHVFYPLTLSEIPAREFLKAKKLARPITISEFDIDGDEWNRISQQDSGIRLLEGAKKLTLQPVEFFDSDLRKFVMPNWQKASKIIHNYLHKSPNKTGDMFLLWRLKEMIRQDLFDAQGELKHMRDFEIKNKGAVVNPIETEEVTA